MNSKKRKIKRVSSACNYCKLKRTKCTGTYPCNNCQLKNIKCVFEKPKKRGRKVNNEIKQFDNFSNACNYIYKEISIDTPITNNEESIFDILVNIDLINTLYKYSSFELVPFYNYNIIINRIKNREIHFSVLFGLYALSEFIRPYGDVNDISKFKFISFQFIELSKIKQQINDIQVIEALYLLSIIERGGLKCYYFTKCALKLFIYNNMYDLDVVEYKEEMDKKKKNTYILQVYYTIYIFHLISQVSKGLIEYIDLSEPKEEITFSNLDDNNFSNISNFNAVKVVEENIKLYENLPKYILIKKLKNDEIFYKSFKINEFTKKIDINDLLSLRYYGKNIIANEEIKALNFFQYMNQPTKCVSVYTNCFYNLRNTLFLYTNMNNKNIKFNASLLIKEDLNFEDLHKNLPHEFIFTSSSYYTDPTSMFLYKRRFCACFIAFRIFLYRVILRLITKSKNSKNLTTNVKTILDPNIINNEYNTKLGINKEKEKILNESNNEKINDTIKFEADINKSPKLKENYKIFDHNQIKQKYWINYSSYMEMTNEEIYEFNSSCIYHKIICILKNVINKNIDWLLNQYIFLSRLSIKKAIESEKTQYYEFPSVIALYEIGTIYLSKYIANHGIENYSDDLITFFTDIDKLKVKINSNNWYFGMSNYLNINEKKTDKIDKIETFNIKNSTNLIIENNKNKNIKKMNQDIDSNNRNKIFKNEFISVHENNYYNNNDDDNKNFYTNTNNKQFFKNELHNNENKIEKSKDFCEYILELIINSKKPTEYCNLGEILHDFIDHNYHNDIKEKKHCCKECINGNKNNSKDEFIEILKILKYFYHANNFVPKHCSIYKSHDNVNKIVYTDSSLPTYQYFYNELSKLLLYTKEAADYVNNFKYLIDKANYALNNGIDSFENDTIFPNSFF